jgi:hypothetical protein
MLYIFNISYVIFKKIILSILHMFSFVLSQRKSDTLINQVKNMKRHININMIYFNFIFLATENNYNVIVKQALLTFLFLSKT